MQIPETIVTISRAGEVIRRLTLRPGEYVIGRRGADIPIEDSRVAARHAQLTVNFEDLLIEDLGSPVGTFVNERRVDSATRIWPGQKVLLGDVVLEARRVRVPRTVDGSLSPATSVLRRLLPDELLHDRKYCVGKAVAQGGMGAVLEAKELTTGRNVAMKVMLNHHDPTDLRRFVREAQVTAQLEHPNIVPVHELGVDEQEHVFYTMKYVRGITLKKVLALLGRGFGPAVNKYPLANLLTIFQKVCDAVAFAHSRGVIHRDLKPENIMIGDYGEVLVMDWGLAKVMKKSDPATDLTGPVDPAGGGRVAAPASGDSMVTVVGAVVGTPQYMSPEQASGSVEALNRRADIYSLGAILYTILVLRPPVGGSTPEKVLAYVRSGRFTPLAQAAARAKTPLRHLPGERIPDSLAAVVMKAMSFHPEHRYRTVTELQADVAAYQRGYATSAECAGLLRLLMLLICRHRSEAIILAIFATTLLSIGPILYVNLLRERNAAVEEMQRRDAIGDIIREPEERFRSEAEKLSGRDRARPSTLPLPFRPGIGNPAR
ncbi:MAG: FHA domain-containing serine/threonine-protein kinase [Chthoniobacteraceae bacterium]